MKLHIVPARTGLAWVKLGIRAFWRQPMALAALFFMTMAAMSLATMIPLVGPAVALALLPSATLAMMVAAAEAVQGRFPTPAVLLVAFRTGRQHLRDMLVLGALYAVRQDMEAAGTTQFLFQHRRRTGNAGARHLPSTRVRRGDGGVEQKSHSGRRDESPEPARTSATAPWARPQ